MTLSVESTSICCSTRTGFQNRGFIGDFVWQTLRLRTVYYNQ